MGLSTFLPDGRQQRQVKEPLRSGMSAAVAGIAMAQLQTVLLTAGSLSQP